MNDEEFRRRLNAAAARLAAQVADACDCPYWLVMDWQLPTGEWLDSYIVMSDDRDSPADARQYEQLGCIAWRVRCPNCGQNVVTGETPPQ